ncbi:MAG: prepilin peptidase [Dermatophilaceae bacterium]
MTVATGPIWAVAVAVLAGSGVGVVLSRALGTAAYRLDDEIDRPVPRGGWVVAVAVPVAWGLLTWRLGGLVDGLLLPPLLLLVVVGTALTRVDLDVHRLPQGLTRPALPAVLGLLLVAALGSGQWWPLGRALLAGVLTWLAYTLASLLPGGGMGAGDATVGGLLGLVLGFLGGWAALVGVLVAFLLGGVVAGVGLISGRLGPRSSLAFGPYLFLGGLIAALTVTPVGFQQAAG